MSTLAVVIPTYNRAQLALRAVESVLAQGDAVDEIILVDDGSSDETEPLFRSRTDIRYIRQTNGGLSAARNTGIRATDAEWVAFLDDDDRFLSGKLAQDRALIAAHPETDVVYGNGRRATLEGEDLGLCLINHQPPASPLRATLEENYLLVQTMVVRRSALLAAGLFDPNVRLCEDVDLWVRLAAHTDRFRFAPEPLTEVLRMPGAMSADPIRMQEALLAVGVRHAELIRKALGGPAHDWWLAGPHYRLGRTWYDRGEWAKARTHLRAALAADPSHRNARLYLTLSLLGGVGRWPFTAARNAKRAVWQLLARRGWVETRW